MFTTRTDTEVLLQRVRRMGRRLPRPTRRHVRVRGVGRCATSRLFCARDRLGIKPFYYATPNGCFVFASEIKALLAFPECRREADDQAVVGFLVHGNCDYAERTLFRGISALPAAHALTVDGATGRTSTRRYWRLDHDRHADKATPRTSRNCGTPLSPRSAPI